MSLTSLLSCFRRGRSVQFHRSPNTVRVLPRCDARSGARPAHLTLRSFSSCLTGDLASVENLLESSVARQRTGRMPRTVTTRQDGAEDGHVDHAVLANGLLDLPAVNLGVPHTSAATDSVLAAATGRPLKRTISSPSCRQPLRAQMLLSWMLRSVTGGPAMLCVPGDANMARLVLVVALPQLDANVRLARGPLNVHLQHVLLVNAALEHCMQMSADAVARQARTAAARLAAGRGRRFARVGIALGTAARHA